MIIINDLLTSYANVTNEIEVGRNDTLMLSDILTLHSRASAVLDEADFEIRSRKDIIRQAGFLLPSKYIIPVHKLKTIIDNETQSDRIHSVVFQNDNELNLLYNFESTVTVFDHGSQSFHSILTLPLTDFSEQFHTFQFPILSTKDQNRLHSLRSLSNLNISRLLCSNRNKILKIHDRE